MSVLVGVDAGASHTEAVVSDESLKPQGRSRGPRGAVTADTVHAAAEDIAMVVRGALTAAGLDHVDRVVVGAAGAGQDTLRAALEAALGQALGAAVRLSVTTDAAVALEAAFPSGSGVVLIAGTGSIAWGRDEHGLIHRAGGLGWEVGDEGSGYALARSALTTVARDPHHDVSQASLREHLQREAGVQNVDALVRWSQQARPFEVAALAKAVCEAADGGDEVARVLVHQAARDLADLVKELVDRMGPRRPLRVAFAGRLLTPRSPVRRKLTVLLHERAGLDILETDVDPAIGALRMARRLDA